MSAKNKEKDQSSPDAKNENKEKPKEIEEMLEKDEYQKLSSCEKILEAIWPVRFKTRTEKDTGELFIKTTLRNLFVYIVFLVVVCIIVYGMVGLINFYFSSGMLSLFIDQPTVDPARNPNQVTFRGGFFTHDDIWNFLTTPLLSGLYFETWYDLNPTPPEDIGYIFYQNKILGRPRLLQIRVKDQSCSVPSAFKKLINDCIASYSPKVESKETFGKGLNNLSTSDITYSAWNYQEDPDARIYSGSVSSYPGNGFMILLGEYQNDSLAIIEDLKQNKWIDEQTRAIIIDFTVYNGNINLFNSIRLVMELPSTGGILNSWTVRTSKLLRYVSYFDQVVMGFEFVFVVFILYYTIEELLDLRLHKLKYIKTVTNLLDWIILGLSYSTIAISIYRTITVNTLLDRLIVEKSQFENFDRLTFFQELFNQMSAVLVFFCWIKVFKYISINKTLAQLSKTLSKSGNDLIYFLLTLALIFTAFGTLGFLLFGEILSDYQSFFITLFTLFRILLGDFNFVDLNKNFPILGPFFFVTFVFIGFFVLLNMFMAIINDSYSEVKEEQQSADPEFMVSDFLKMNIGRFKDKVSRKRNVMLDAFDILKTCQQVCGEEDLSFNLWRNEMKKKGYSDTEIEAFFSKYDKNCDNMLNTAEKLELIKDISKAKSHISDEFRRGNEDKDENEIDAENVDLEEEEEEEEEEATEESKLMNRDDFDYVVGRIDRMELSVATIINKIDKLFTHLENVEIEKMRKRQEISKMLLEHDSPEMEKSLEEIIGPTEYK